MSQTQPSEFARLVKYCRQGRGWSMSELARRSSITQPEISRLENARRTPTIRHVKALAKAFSVKTIEGEPKTYADWLVLLVEHGEDARIDARKNR